MQAYGVRVRYTLSVAFFSSSYLLFRRHSTPICTRLRMIPTRRVEDPRIAFHDNPGNCRCIQFRPKVLHRGCPGVEWEWEENPAWRRQWCGPTVRIGTWFSFSSGPTGATGLCVRSGDDVLSELYCVHAPVVLFPHWSFIRQSIPHVLYIVSYW